MVVTSPPGLYLVRRSLERKPMTVCGVQGAPVRYPQHAYGG